MWQTDKKTHTQQDTAELGDDGTLLASLRYFVSVFMCPDKVCLVEGRSEACTRVFQIPWNSSRGLEGTTYLTVRSHANRHLAARET